MENENYVYIGNITTSKFRTKLFPNNEWTIDGEMFQIPITNWYKPILIKPKYQDNSHSAV